MNIFCPGISLKRSVFLCRLMCLVVIFFFAFIVSGCQSYHVFQPQTASYEPDGIYPWPAEGDDLIGENLKVTAGHGETLQSIGLAYNVGRLEMLQANPSLPGWKTLSPGAQVNVPTQYILPPKQYRHGIVINIAELRLYYFDQTDHTIMTFPIALGRQGWRTPVGKTYIVRKQADPSWHVPKSIHEYHYKKTGEQLPDVIPPGPGNPLGLYALYLGINGYLIHGTNDQNSIGNLVSSGCIRLHNKDVEKLFYKVKQGTRVFIIYYPNKVGWMDGKLYLESQKPIHHSNGLYAHSEVPLHTLIEDATKTKKATIDWNAVGRISTQKTGIAGVIGSESSWY